MITAEHVKRLADEYALHFPNESAMRTRKELQDAINALCEQNALLMVDLINTKRETWKKDRVIGWFKSWTGDHKIHNVAGISTAVYKDVVQRF